MTRKMKDVECFESQPYRDFISDVKGVKTTQAKRRPAGAKVAILGKSPMRKSASAFRKSKSPNMITFAKSPYEVPKRFRLPEYVKSAMAMQNSSKRNLWKPTSSNAPNRANSRIQLEQPSYNNISAAEVPIQDEAAANSSTMKDVSRLNISQEEEDREFIETRDEIGKSQQMQLEQLELEAFMEQESKVNLTM